MDGDELDSVDLWWSEFFASALIRTALTSLELRNFRDVLIIVLDLDPTRRV